MTQLYFKFVNHVNNIDGVPSFYGLKSILNSYQNDKQGGYIVNDVWYDLNDYYKKVSGHDINDNGWTSNLQWIYLFVSTKSSYTLPLAYLSVYDTQQQADNYDVNNAHYSLYKILDKTYNEQVNYGQNFSLTGSDSGYNLKLGENKTYYLRIDIGNPTDAVYNYPFVSYNHQPFDTRINVGQPRIYDGINDITCAYPISLNGIVYTGKSTTDVYYNFNFNGTTSAKKFNTNNKVYRFNYLNYNEYFVISPYNSSKPDKIIIDFLHSEETTVKIMFKANDSEWRPIAVNPTNYNFTESKGDQVWLETDLNPDSTKYITASDTIYNIYYFKDGKPEDLDINNYSLDYLNKNATTKYVTRTTSNMVESDYNNSNTESKLDDKYYETFKTPCAFNGYGYYLILPVELKDYYGILVDSKGTVLQKVYPNKENKIEVKNRPKNKDEVIGYFNEPYGEVGGDLINSYYYAHSKDYGITSQSYIDPNRYDSFICMPFDLFTNGVTGELPAFKLKYKELRNVKTDLGGYYNPTTGKIDPITIKENTGTGGSTINSNNQVHLYSINQQNIIDLSSKDLTYQTSLNGFATYNANNFINQVYILPFSLPTNLKENVSNIVTGLYKLDTDTIAINQDHYDLNLGSITIKPKYNNGFDYNVIKCDLHLPFTNLINLDINDILNKTISIKYKVSLLNADTTINILSDDNLIFTGKINIGTDLQLFSINSNNIAGLLNSVLQNEVLTPYITITRNKPINNLVSYETNEHGQLSSYHGYLQTTSATVSCGTQEEQQEIENLLNGGIYIK